MKTVQMTIALPQADLLNLVAAEVHADYDYARAWHNSIVRAALEAGVTSVPQAAKIAAAFMVGAFGLEHGEAAKIAIGRPLPVGGMASEQMLTPDTRASIVVRDKETGAVLERIEVGDEFRRGSVVMTDEAAEHIERHGL